MGCWTTRVEPPGAVVTEQTPASAGQPYQQPYEQPSQQPYGQAYQQPYASPGQQPYPGYAYPAPPTNQMAIVSLIASIVGVTILPLIGSIVGVITGHSARRQIRETGEGGEGMATAGIVVGWIGLGIAGIGVLMMVLFFAGFAVFGLAAGQ